MKNAIVTFAIGKQYEDMYNNIFRPSVENYCKKFDIDLIVVTEPFETFEEKQALCCQKLLICSQPWAEKYDAICWLESDILISPYAPNVFDQVTDDKILFVKHSPYNDDFYENIWRIKNNIEVSDDKVKYYKDLNLYEEGHDISNVFYINEGVTVFQPKHHKEYLENMYRNHDFKQYKPSQSGKDGTFSAVRETWWWYQIMIENKHRFIDYKFNSLWNYYRRMHLEPFDDTNSLLLPIKNYIENSFFCHIGDRENIDMIHFIDRAYFRKFDTTLVVNCKAVDDLGWLFVSYIRAKKFKNVYIVCSDDSARNYIYQNFPRFQNGYYLPDNFYTFVNECPRLEGRVITCDSDWTRYKDLQYIIDLFYEDKNDNDLIKVVYHV